MSSESSQNLCVYWKLALLMNVFMEHRTGRSYRCQHLCPHGSRLRQQTPYLLAYVIRALIASHILCFSNRMLEGVHLLVFGPHLQNIDPHHSFVKKKKLFGTLCDCCCLPSDRRWTWSLLEKKVGRPRLLGTAAPEWSRWGQRLGPWFCKAWIFILSGH